MISRLSSGPAAALRRKGLPLLLAACFGAVQAAPTSPQVVAGQASFSQQGNVFSITNTPNTIINWQSFSVGAGEVTRFVQQSGSSAVLNRILGQDPSRIFGALQSNGRVFLINPNGVMFGRDSRVDVAGLVASSLNLSNSDFLAGRNNFTAVAGAGAVSNAGSIATPAGGRVYLVAPNVDNNGIITSPQGDVMLAAGHSVQLVEEGDPAVRVMVSAPDNAALNLGQVIAQGGRIGIYGALVNQRGRLNADSAVVGENGRIVLKASRDTLLEAGSVTSATGAGRGGEVAVLGRRVALTGDARIDASGQSGGGTVLVGGDYQGANAAVQNAETTVVGADARIRADAIGRGDGGKIVVWADGATSMAGRLSARGGAAGGDGGMAEASGKQFLDFRGTADLRAPRGQAGTLLLDPNNISIATGSDIYIGQNGGDPFEFEGYATPAVLTPLTITNQLGLSDVRVFTSTGSITVQSPVNWSNSSELTLSAATGIAVNAQVGNSGGGKLALHTVGGDITQSAAISVPTLAAIADGGGVMLTHGGNSVGTLAGSGATGFAYYDADALTIGTVSGGAITTQSGVRSSGGDVNITSGVGGVSGGLAIDGVLSAPTGILNLRNYMGDISQSAQLNAAAALIIADQGAVTLNNTSNSLIELAGYSNAAAGFSFVNSGGFTVGTVAGSNGVLSFGAAPLSLTAKTGDLTVSNTTYGVNAGGGASALSLTASGGQVLGTGIVKGGVVTITSAGGISLAGTQNAIGTLSASVSGSGDVEVVNNRALSIASISTGADNAAIDVSTSAGSAFGIEVGGAIGTGATGSVTLNAGGSGAITRVGGASIISTNHLTLQSASGGAVGTSALPLLAGAVRGGTTDLHTGTVGDGPQGLYLSQAGKLRLNAGSHYGYNAAVNIAATGDLTIAGDVGTGTAALTLGSTGTIQMLGDYLVQAGALDLTAATGIHGGDSAAPLAIMAASVQARNTTSGPVRLSNSGTNLSVGGAGNYGIDQQGAGDVYLDNAGGYTTSIDQSVTSAGGGISITSDNMNLAGSITSASGVMLAPHSAGVLVEVGALAADSGGVLRLTSAELNGVHAPVLRIGSSTAGAIAIESALGNGSGGAFEHVGSALKLESGGAITQAAGATIGGVDKVAFTGASVALDQANGTGRVAGDTSGDFSYRSANRISVEAVDGIGGITAGAGRSIRLKSDGAGIGQHAGAPLIASGGTLVLEAAGAAELELGSNNFAILGGALNQGGAGTRGPSQIHTGSNLSIGSGTAMDGVTTINGLTTNNQDLALSTGLAIHQLTVDQAINAGTAGVTLEADNLALNDTVTANTVVLRPHTTGRPITVGSDPCQDGGAGGCLALTRLDRVVAANIGIGRRYADAGAPGDIHVAGITGAGTGEATDINPATTLIVLGSGGAITQSGPIVVDTLGLSAGGHITLSDAGNLVSTLAAETNGKAVMVNNSAGFTVGVAPANTLIEAGGGTIGGVRTLGGDVALAIDGGASSELTISRLIDAGAGDVMLNSSGTVYGATGTNDITAGTLGISADGGSARAGIGAIDGSGGLHTTVPRISSMRAPAGGIRVASLTGLVVGPTTATSDDFVRSGGTLALSTASGHALTVNGNIVADGDIELTAGAAGSANTLDRIHFERNVSSSGGNITLNANSVSGANVPTGGNVTSRLFVPLPPDTTPTLADCVANPALAGCAAVLPNLAACTANPAIPGCGAVLPGLGICITAPNTAGCEAVLPTVAMCAVTPTLAGCSAVLPTVAACTVTPTLPGCLAVLPTVAACTVTPTLPGCSAVLPTVAACTVTPTLPGCLAVLPTLAACTVTPTLPGCLAVLPTVAACTATPTLPACLAVLPTVAACTATPTLPGCLAVLPTVAACSVTPTLAGCPAVLPTVAACAATPALPGCGAVLPTLAACVGTPALPGCSSVLPGLAACVATPALAGCSAVLPTPGACLATPGTPGCPAIPPTLAACVATPGAAGCAAVLPSLGTCVAAPATAGCVAVLPTLAQCGATPTLAGCVTVAPPVDVCAISPGAPGCQVVTPPTLSPSSGPVAQAFNSTISVINAVTAIGDGGGSAAFSSVRDDGDGKEKGDVKEAVVAQKTGPKSELPKKTYCN